MKKIISLLVLLVMLISLVACAGGNNEDEPKKTTNYPVGNWVLMYYGNSQGEYVEELNQSEFSGVTDIIAFICEKYGDICYFKINEDGKALYHKLNGEEFECEFDDEKITFDFGITEYKLTGDHFYLEDPEFQGSYLVMFNVSDNTLAKMLEGCYGTVELKDAKVGDLVALGKYETSPGNDRLEWLKWRVLDKDGDKLLIICDELIDSYAYNTNPNQVNLDKVNWKDSTCRAFLNNETDGFLSMFSEEERSLIQVTHVDNTACNDILNEIWKDFEDQGKATYSDMTKQHVPDGEDTDDKVFLLSVKEVLKYFGDEVIPPKGKDLDDYPFSVMNTYPKAVAKVTLAVDDNGSGYYDLQSKQGAWMTRTLSNAKPESGMMVTYITGDGQVYCYYTFASMFIRPAMWIEVK